MINTLVNLYETENISKKILNWLFPTDVVNKLYLYILCIKSIFVLNNNLKILGEVGADAELIMMPITTTVWLLL